VSFLRRRRGAELPPDWEQLVTRHVAHWKLLDPDERTRLGDDLATLVTTKRWEAAQGFELTDRHRVVIAAQAALLVLGLDVDWYRDVSTIIVHPTTMRYDRSEPGPVAGTEVYGSVHLIGEAAYRGPLAIAWDAASIAARHPDRGYDVVLHEFAHKLDMLDGVIDGTPPLHDDELRERWVRVCTHEFERLGAGLDEGGLIDDYAATDAGEFFAVVTETFFGRPVELDEHHHLLYGVLRDFYRQDPAARARRALR
jgi:Mlc titration factor MtfA (ptsG expression regulator)